MIFTREYVRPYRVVHSLIMKFLTCPCIQWDFSDAQEQFWPKKVKAVSEMTYTVSSGTLNPSIPYQGKGKGMVLDVAPLSGGLYRFTTLEVAADWRWL